jgi:hypothetical protein
MVLGRLRKTNLFLPIDANVRSIQLTVSGWCNVRIMKKDGPASGINLTMRPSTAPPYIEEANGALTVRFPGTLDTSVDPMQHHGYIVDEQGFTHHAWFAPATLELYAKSGMQVGFTIV